ncbi:hypothetical protein DL95DRAFT_445826 [Leptodontidium sp. 2 PMI_412]|nr:hypothetical protein BKA61DRAFT_354131 [Leptodontidium sp. MPI-SDFR-AT-0119]KAH9215796.1 hypothetical protein DL95DRAFT_445826 [Leptodontidium sp. 2 PMI_412]
MAVDLGLSLFVSTGILLAAASITTAFRCIARIYVVRSFGIDDWLMVLTLAIFAHYSAWVFYGRSIDKGRPDEEIPLSDVVPALRAFYFAEVSYFLDTGFLKLSIGTFLLRIVKTKLQRWSIYIALGIISLYSMIAFFVAVFQCKPISHFWHPEGPGSCLKKEVILGIGYSHGTIIAISDFFFAALPMFVVWSLQMDRKMKVSVSVLMGFGAIAGITTIARFPYISAIVKKEDFFHNTTRLATLSSVEPGLGIILCSAAATRPLFRSLIVKTKAWSGARSHTTGDGAPRRDNVRSVTHNHGDEEFIRLNSREGIGKDFGNVVVKDKAGRGDWKRGV